MKKRFIALMAIGAMLLSGCGVSADVVINEDGTYKSTTKNYYTEEELTSEDYEGMFGEDVAIGKESEIVERNGVKYYVFTEEKEGSFDEYEDAGIGSAISKGSLYGDLATADDESNESMEMMLGYYDFMDYSFTFQETIVETNLELSEDGKTVSFGKDDLAGLDKIYAFSAEVLADDSVKPYAVNADDSKKIKNNKKYKKGLQLQFLDNATGIRSAKLDGKKVITGVTVTKKGAHKLVLEDFAGNTATIKFTIKK